LSAEVAQEAAALLEDEDDGFGSELVDFDSVAFVVDDELSDLVSDDLDSPDAAGVVDDDFERLSFL
jgi:hypothetical protein